MTDVEVGRVADFITKADKSWLMLTTYPVTQCLL